MPQQNTISKADDKERLEILDRLGAKITDLFQERAHRRGTKELEWQRAMRLYNDPLSDANDVSDSPFNQGDTKRRRVVPNIVRTKCDTAIANCISLQFAAGEKNWDIFPPANNTDPAVANACRLMEKEIQAQLDATKYPMHSRRAMEDRVILGTGVMKGPVNTGHLRVEYIRAPDGTWLPQVSTGHTPKVTNVPVWRFYPDDTVSNFDEIEDVIEINPMTPLELSQYINHPGFDGEAIKRILKGDADCDPIKPDVYNDTLQRISAESWSRNPYLYKNRYMVLEYHGPVTYDDINKLGLCPTYESPTQEYYGEVWVCAGKVIRMELENIEGYYETPYSVSIWKRDPSSLFGFGHPLLLADAQQVVTQSYHMILDNASITSAPQFAIFKKYIQPIDGDWTLAPGKGWLLTDPSASVDQAIKFFNPTNNIPNIMPVLELARQFAEEESATLSSPTQSPENSESATGQLIMRNASNTLLDFMAEEWDDQVTEKVIRRMYSWNMQYNPKEEIKGDYVVDVKSSSEYKNKQMYIRDLERLSMEMGQNPALAMAINVDELTKARLALMHLPSNRILKTDEEIQAAQQAAQNQPDPTMIELQIKMMEAQTNQETVNLKKAQLAFEQQQQQQRELWEHEERMGSNQARLAEANATVLKARTESQIELIKLAQSNEQFAAKLATDKELAILAQHSNVFLKSMEESRKTQENELFNKELEFKKNNPGVQGI